jgi:hypothetical protein
MSRDNNEERVARVDMLVETAVMDRLRAEFREMPSLRLTLYQAQRLCRLETALCQHALDRLVETKFLSVNTDGRRPPEYRRLR